MPPHLAGRTNDKAEFKRLLDQDVVLENLILTGLRGVGKTVLLETFKPMAISEGWLWVGTDLSETVSVSEDNLAIRLLTDLSVVTSGISQSVQDKKVGFTIGEESKINWNYAKLVKIYNETPGLVADKLKTVLEIVWSLVNQLGKKGIIFAYDEAQNLADNAEKDQYPLSTLLDVFQSLQRKEFRMMLALTGLPTLLPKLVEARTYSERMFRVVFLDRLEDSETKQAIKVPIEKNNCPVRFDENSISTICEVSGGYPYFIQFICKEVYDRWVQQHAEAGQVTSIPVDEIVRKLDADFFSGRWARVTDRQRDVLKIVARMPNPEFTVQEIVTGSHHSSNRPFTNSRVSAILNSLMEAGLVYRNRHGKYRFAVPMFGQFILRHLDDDNEALLW
ncbi:MAG: ATP-binding protein [Acidobacteria bacterium]|nr:ATP-binding protein [Acidobacteriota bacterium]